MPARRHGFELCEDLDRDMWGRPYKEVMAQLKAKASPPNLSRAAALRALEGLFPISTDAVLRRNPLEGAPYPQRLPEGNPEEWKVTAQELQEAVNRLNPSKSPGWDNVPPTIVKGVGNHDRSTKVTSDGEQHV